MAIVGSGVDASLKVFGRSVYTYSRREPEFTYQRDYSVTKSLCSTFSYGVVVVSLDVELCFSGPASFDLDLLHRDAAMTEWALASMAVAPSTARRTTGRVALVSTGEILIPSPEARDESGHLIRELHGVTLKAILEALVQRYGWEELAREIRVNCFAVNPSVKSSLTFLRRTPWARAKVEALYVEMRTDDLQGPEVP